VPCTINGCAKALEMTPWIATDCVRRGYEISCHGYRWESHEWMSEDVQRKRIADAVRVCGLRPVGWHARTSHSVNTRRLLIEEGGFATRRTMGDKCIASWTRASSADGSTKALLLPKIDANRGRERDTRHVVCSDGDGKDCPWTRWPSF
jgi:hypothetical protein